MVAVPFTVVGTLVSKGPNEDDDFTIRNMEEVQVLKAQETSARVMSVFAPRSHQFHSAVGGIGIMNIMLVSAAERT